ncbi:hypothetical protein K1T73_09260 [Roseovarius sp. SCSIO 43702]|uniref:DUF6477 family protein n=1 Tax=Roseovarius sp. SCSIO 43702 TaxID=2823043 RepID=UPI001C73C685|nr:DUF6477 family protein [Roseovarius sp. SCSIO 43702]QYX55306.1 hypothetical protein K1T73_09260 [Roseovarius sp. SCSIO 43702]
MHATLAEFSALRRPRLLIRAARIGVSGYTRKAHLPRILGFGRSLRGPEALRRLLDVEAALEEQRRDDDTAYSVARHVDVLIAMMGEARLLRAAAESRAPQPEPAGAHQLDPLHED